jgi:hypothetical protein
VSENNSVSKSWHYRILWIVAILSLLLSVILLIGLIDFRLKAARQVASAANFLDDIEMEDYDLPVHIDESLAISMTVPFSDTFTVPISSTVPVSTSVPFQDNVVVPINTVIPVNTTVNVPIEIPFAGPLDIPFPISTNIPVNLTVNVPIEQNIPVVTDIPVNLMVDVPIQSDIPIETEIPVQLDFPVTIPMDEMGFQTLLQQVQEALDLVADLLGQNQG